jgi:hypothetical protein
MAGRVKKKTRIQGDATSGQEYYTTISHDPRSFNAIGCKEGNYITRFLFRDSIQRKILIVAVCLLASAWVPTPALAQHGGHVGGGGHFNGGARMGVPHVFAPASRTRISRGPVGFGTGRFLFRRRPIFVFSNPVFFGAPFFRFGAGFNSVWWPTCGPFWTWGFGCNNLAFYGYGSENYVTPQPYESPVYLYGGEERGLIGLYLNDGRVYGAIDYWFVNGDIHFTMAEEGGGRAVEHVIPFDELDLQRTIDVNTRRGFRMVLRDEPWQQYLKDHPNLTPPDLRPPQKN